MNKQQLIETIRKIEPDFNGKGTVQLLNLKLKSLQPAMDKAAEEREQKQSVASNMEAANKTVETNGSKFAKIRGEIMNDMETGEIVRGRVKANVWSLMVADLKIRPIKVEGKTEHIITAELSDRQVMTRSANPEPVKGEFHKTFASIQLDAMRETITDTAMKIYTEAQKKERNAWIRQKEATFNSALRNCSKDMGIDAVSMASAGTGEAKECYFKITERKDIVPEADKSSKQKKTEAKAKLQDVASADKTLDNVTPLEAIEIVAMAMIKGGKCSANDMMVALDKVHGKIKALQAKEAKANAA